MVYPGDRLFITALPPDKQQKGVVKNVWAD